jgi:hypothetical protein
MGCTTGQPCNGASTFPLASCQGNYLGYCHATTSDGGVSDAGYLEVELSCADLGGSTCGEFLYARSTPPTEVAGCIGPGPACTADRCDGSTLVSCVGGHEARLDCAPSGLACVTRKDSALDGPTFIFCAAGTECKTSAFCGLGTECGYDYADSCKGNILTYCDAGKIATLDCVKAGWTGCISDKQGTRCSP